MSVTLLGTEIVVEDEIDMVTFLCKQLYICLIMMTIFFSYSYFKLQFENKDGHTPSKLRRVAYPRMNN